MKIVTKTIKLNTDGNTDIINITGQVSDALKGSGLKNGILTVFINGSTAGITTVEYEPGLVDDLKAFFEKIAPKNGSYEHNVRWHDGNGYAHVRASLLGPDISVPFMDGAPRLGTWQQIIFIDFDNRPRSRELTVQIVGE